MCTYTKHMCTHTYTQSSSICIEKWHLVCTMRELLNISVFKFHQSQRRFYFSPGCMACTR